MQKKRERQYKYVPKMYTLRFKSNRINEMQYKLY